MHPVFDIGGRAQQPRKHRGSRRKSNTSGTLIGEGHHDRVVVSAGRGRRLRRNPAIDRNGLGKARAGAGQRIGAILLPKGGLRAASR